MTLRIYNSLTRKKEDFATLEAGKVKMYVCGVTVYDYCHLGHARAYVVWDMVRRYLSTKYEVRYVQNITDIDDKILNRAKERGITMQTLAEEFIAAYDRDMANLNILPADEYPRATESIPAIIALIQTLEQAGYAYAVGGDVYYAVQKFPSYGKLSGRKLEDMRAGASGRVDGDEPLKHYPFDFALWKSAKPDEPFWESPWGNGRPGWHIECSAMVRSRLGDRIDIHAGGADLQFPHHENEIAQSEAVTHQPLANYWMHNGFVNIEGEKMSKSLGNFTTIRTLLEHYDPMVVRFFILQAHYRQPIDFTNEAIIAATKGWETIHEGLLFARDFGKQLGWQSDLPAYGGIQQYVDRFNEAMDDDFNTSIALSVVFELAKDLRTERNILVHSGKTETSPEHLVQVWKTLVYLSHILGLETETSPQNSEPESHEAENDILIEQLIQQRVEARQTKNWKESDRLRDELKAMNIILIDQPDGTTRWRR
ncbi:cysteine--tRNA ligase [Tumidithrix elongata RA019]|uniref:Cysteine--tRNA ligase n=1 Tax=Tumidithrix elongata BACA0141 TaxID=2716417 RepID=A0AAW9Q6Y1_9CYAN|nr:cysteine--tRNA ligase [Tumidithrix elongata RA019]